MKRLAFILIILIISTGKIFAQTAASDKILGNWLNAEKDARIEIYKTDNKYYGKVIWGKNIFNPDGSSRTDLKNPDEKLKSRLLLNLVILTNFTYDDGEWNGGKIYDPKNGKTYSCFMKLEGSSLKIRGYIGITLLGRTTIWTRG
jgi:uncharacterized protein (DUF2147 family)